MMSPADLRERRERIATALMPSFLDVLALAGDDAGAGQVVLRAARQAVLAANVLMEQLDREATPAPPPTQSEGPTMRPPRPDQQPPPAKYVRHAAAGATARELTREGWTLTWVSAYRFEFAGCAPFDLPALVLRRGPDKGIAVALLEQDLESLYVARIN